MQPILQGARAIIAFARSTGGGVEGGDEGQFLLIERSQAGAVQAPPGELKQRDGGVNENGKNAIGVCLDWENNNSALESRFSAFLCRIKQHGV